MNNIFYVSIDTPIYLNLSLETYIDFFRSYEKNGKYLVIFDEIQYLKNWEVHLKDLVDSCRNIKFVASGSAAAALRLKSRESGAGRFSDFMLPPLTFYEFLMFLGVDEDMISVSEAERDDGTKRNLYTPKDIEKLNRYFVDYLNYGGYPEAVLNEEIRRNREQFIKNEIVEKVLLKDLPALYGITEIHKLNQLFSFLAYNAGKEASLANISNQAEIPKPTVKKYIEYLESAYLILKVASVDDSCKIALRERNFKVYLNNPSMRAALFSPADYDDSELISRLTESAIFSQWQHARDFGKLHYARWKTGEVDIVSLMGNRKPHWIGEVKWTDRMRNKWKEETAGLSYMLRRHPSIEDCFMTTKTISSESTLDGRNLELIPSALYCYQVGRNVTNWVNRDLDPLAGLEIRSAQKPPRKPARSRRQPAPERSV